MLTDYYRVLEVSDTASPEEIKKAFRRMAQRWHPDRNPGTDTVARMQAINEAYLILNDPEARARFDAECQRYRQFAAARASKPKVPRPEAGPVPEPEEYVFSDDILKRWVENARRQASELSRQTGKEFRKGAEAAAGEMGKSLVSFLVIGMVFMVIFALSKGCG